jgi:hypothetical protein
MGLDHEIVMARRIAELRERLDGDDPEVSAIEQLRAMVPEASRNLQGLTDQVQNLKGQLDAVTSSTQALVVRVTALEVKQAPPPTPEPGSSDPTPEPAPATLPTEGE